MTSVLAQLAAGDPAAVRRLLDEHGGLMYGIARRYLGGDGAAVEDAMQDVLISVWQSAGSYDPRLGSEAAYVATIARRRMIDVRRRPRRPAIGLASVAAPAREPISSEDLARLGGDFARLPDEER